MRPLPHLKPLTSRACRKNLWTQLILLLSLIYGVGDARKISH